MPNAINLRLESEREGIDPDSFLGSIRNFLAILRNLDSALSHDSRGSIYWEIGNIHRGSPTVIAIVGESHRSDVDFTSDVQDLCIKGLRQLDEIAERPTDYSDATLNKVKNLASYLKPGRKRRLESIEVYSDEESNYPAHVRLSHRLTANITGLLETRYDSLGSVVGNLDSVTIHAGTEFRV